MNSIDPYTASSLHPWDLGAQINNYHELHLTRIAASFQQSENITLFTQEGDRVTISGAEEKRISYETYEAIAGRAISGTKGNPAASGEGFFGFQGQRLELETSKSLSISVEGDLSEEELQDIRKALKVIDGIMKRVLYGKGLSEDMGRPLMLGELDSLSSIEANYGYTRVISLEEESAREVDLASLSGVSNDLAPTVDYHPELKSPTEQMGEVIANSGVKPSKFIKPIKGLFSNIIRGLPQDSPLHGPRVRLAKLIKGQLLHRIEQQKGQVPPASDRAQNPTEEA